MSDDDFLRALENCELLAREFGHTAHVRAAYLYLGRTEFAGALARMRHAVRNYAAHLGKPDRYHETITVAYLALIHERMYERGDGGGWESFAVANGELLDPGLLRQFYPPDLLESQTARRVFVLPRSMPPTAPGGGHGLAAKISSSRAALEASRSRCG
jgi:hypothetical protein